MITLLSKLRVARRGNATVRRMEDRGASREKFSTDRLQELAEGLADIESLLDEAKLCVYATGSYGRLEAWEGSDIDLFFLYEDNEAFSYLTFLRVAARLVDKTELMDFPPFSGDGKYLESLDVTTMERVLGSREDDQSNTFTARMLLLLESRPVSDGERYTSLLRRIVGFYFRDFEGHEDDFVPIFLLNDILRFWRTLTLNYEHDRFEARAKSDPAERQQALAKSGLKNYKLKLSRLATCFSMVLHLACDPAPVTADRVIELCGATPQGRFEQLRGRGSESDALLDQLQGRYATFLSNVQHTEEELLEAFSDRERRKEHLAEANAYGNCIFDLATILVPEERLRHLII